MQSSVDIGRIIFWSGKYGFIQPSQGNSVFFHKSNLLETNLENVKLFDEVSFVLSKIEEGPRKGSYIAIQIKKLQDRNITSFQRYIGKLATWDGTSGLIQTPQQAKSVLFFNTRRLNLTDTFQKGEMVVFHQVKSSKNPLQLFALFAYPMAEEQNIDFLRQQHIDSQQNEIFEYINKLEPKEHELTLDDQFELDLNRIGYINNNNAFLALVSKINEYKELGFTPELEILKKYSEGKYVIQLWEMSLISEYDIALMLNYFHYSGADNKRSLISKIKQEDKERIFHYHFEKLKQDGKLLSLNNNVKTLLDITYRNKSSREKNIYNIIFAYLKFTLTSKELLSLWLDEYIDIEELKEEYILQNFDLNNEHFVESLFNKSDIKFKELLEKLFTEFFLNLARDNFNRDHFILIRNLRKFEEKFKESFNDIIKIVLAGFNEYQKYILWIFGVSIDFDAKQYLLNNEREINDFYKLKFFLHKSIDYEDIEILVTLSQVSVKQVGLEIFASTYKWNELVHPTKISPPNSADCYFLPDIKEFNEKYNYNEINVANIANVLYTSIQPAYQVHHLRLWLNNEVEASVFDYYGYRERFKELTSDEQTGFKKKGDLQSYYSDIYEAEYQEVEPCDKIIFEDDEVKVYQAFIENLFFKSGSFLLRKEDKSYTLESKEPFADSGFNRIPKSDLLNQIPIILKVSKEKNQILSAEGFNKLFTSIHTGQIEKVLIKEQLNNPTSSASNNSYAEDWKLRDAIIKYLESMQDKDIAPLSVYEPKKYFRKLNINEDHDAKEHTRLYSIKTPDGFGIIWENIDFTEDRATYIFKSTTENHLAQLQKISQYIVSFAQFRSALSTTQKDSEWIVFKDNLGFISSIRKQRGKNNSFENWELKLQAALISLVPDIHFTTVVEIPQDKIQTVDIDFNNGTSTASDKIFLNTKRVKRIKILEALQAFNN